MIAVASASVPATITAEMEFGSTCEMRIFRRRTPTARAASTKSLSRCASTEPRSKRVKIGMLTIPIAIMTWRRPGPSRATIPIAIRKPGIASMMSTRRISVPSTQPPRKPEIAPSVIPIDSPTDTETIPISKESRAP